MMQLTVLGKSCSGISQPRPANAVTIEHVMMHGPGMHVLTAHVAQRCMAACLSTQSWVT